MSVQAGVRNLDGKPADRSLLEKLSDAVVEYGPDGETMYFDGPIAMLFRPFHTTTESHLERQPYVSRAGFVMTWDGRLDNRDDLIVELHKDLTSDHTDVAIVAAAFERWGPNCFRKLVGDWALSVWDRQQHILILARDYVGIRHLYYYPTHESVIWCTILAPLVLLPGVKFTLNNKYVAGYLAMHPEAHLTPYQEIHAVPPGKFVAIRNSKATIQSYWIFEPKKRIRYKTDAEYEERYRYLFRQAVRRRLRSDSPILADLSGGYDSSSIVCMADEILAHEGAQTPHIDTFSLCDLKEPELDDHLFFTKVEEKRGRTGFHVNLGASDVPFAIGCRSFSAVPKGQLTEELKLARRKIIQEGRYRVSLSGLGGDEVNGQALDFRVLMADLMAQFRLGELARQIKAWSLLTRRPWIQLFFQTCIQLLPLPLRAQMTKDARPERWIDSRFSRCHKLAQRKLGEIEGVQFWFPRMRDWAATLATLTRQISEELPSVEEKRYPYLDRDLVEFLTSIPQDQLLRPGERRSLMRRALVNFLPRAVLARQTKAGASRCFTVVVEKQWHELQGKFASPLSARLGYINPCLFREALRTLKSGTVPLHIADFVRGLTLEYWLRDVARREVISAPPQEVSELETDLAQSRT